MNTYFRNIITLVLCGVCFPNFLFGQSGAKSQIKRSELHRKDRDTSGHNWVISPAIHFSRYFAGEISFSRSYTWTSGGVSPGGHLYGIGMEFLQVDNHIIVAPKFSYEAFIMFVCAKFSLLNYMDFKSQNSLKFRPELGITNVGILNLTYGYNFSLFNKNVFPLKHSLNLELNIFLPKRRWERID